MVELDNFDEYSSTLSPQHKKELDRFATEVAASQGTGTPIRHVSVLGYADQALRVPADQRQAKEMSVSVERAKIALDQVKAAIGRVGGDVLLNRLEFTWSGQGSRSRKYLRPANDTQRRANRRVTVSTLTASDRPVHILPEFPKREPQFPDVSLKKVFKIKLMEGVSSGTSPGIAQYTFVIWDVRDSRAAVYDYRPITSSAGVASPFSGESDWADFLGSSDDTVEGFAGVASIAIGVAPVAFMLLNLSKASVVIYMGLALGLAVESGMGQFQLTPNSVKPFSG